MGIEKISTEILTNAKQNQSKMDDFRKRMRDAMVSSSMPITNQLRNYSEERIITKVQEF